MLGQPSGRQAHRVVQVYLADPGPVLVPEVQRAVRLPGKMTDVKADADTVLLQQRDGQFKEIVLEILDAEALWVHALTEGAQALPGPGDQDSQDRLPLFWMLQFGRDLCRGRTP
jgi:hypothetical protein